MVGTFSLIHFYHVIVKTLSNGTLPWVVETMEWWQRYVSHLSLLHMVDASIPIGRCSVMKVQVPPNHQGTFESLQILPTGVQPNTSSSRAVVESHRRLRYIPGQTTQCGPMLTSHPRTLPSTHIPDGPSVHGMSRRMAPQYVTGSGLVRTC